MTVPPVQPFQPEPKPGSEPLGELVSKLSEQVTRLVRDEMRLAAVELKQKGKRVGIGAGLFGAAGLLGFFGLAALLLCAGLALDLVLPAWLAALIVAAVVLVVAGLLALVGKKDVQAAGAPVPTQAVASVKQDVAEIKERTSR